MNKKYLIYVLFAVVAIILAAFFVFRPKNTALKPGGETQSGRQKTVAAKGEIVLGFDKNLIVDKTARNIESYAIPYSDNEQFTTSQQSDKSVEEIYLGYLDYFNKNSVYVQSKSSTGTLATIFGFKDGSNYSILIQKNSDTKKTDITVSIVKK